MKKEQEYQMTCHNLTVSELNDQRNVLMYTRRAYVRQNPGGISAYLRFVLKRGWCRSRGVTLTGIRLRGPGLKPRPGQKFENENFCFRRTPAVVKVCLPCSVRPIKTRYIKPE